MKTCEKCKSAACVPDERYCVKCRKSILAQLNARTEIPIPKQRYRSSEEMENTRETKYGIDR